MAIIEPRSASGFKDYLPNDMVLRQKMLDTVRAVFERFGFVPLDTPALEREEILTGGDVSFTKQIFYAGLREGEEKLALRFDLTVPLARVVAQYQQEIQKPFKRYHIGKVWRGERPQAGRYREFMQCDVDIVGSAKSAADAEIIAVMHETMIALGVSEFVIRINHRKILNGLASLAGFSENKIPFVLRVIDKIDKIGWDGVVSELTDKKGNLELEKKHIEHIHRFLEIKEKSAEKTLHTLESLMGNIPSAHEGIEDLRAITRHLYALGIPERYWNIDCSVARGLGYYTGPVFETVLTNLLSLGSVFSGGRYDDLVSRFGSNTLPATGASLGADRLFVGLSELKLISHASSISKVFFLNFDPSCEETIETITSLLRREGVATEIYLGSEKSLQGQLAYAVRQNTPVVLILGSEEKEKGILQMKDMRAHKQYTVLCADILHEVKKILQ